MTDIPTRSLFLSLCRYKTTEETYGPGLITVWREIIPVLPAGYDGTKDEISSWAKCPSKLPYHHITTAWHQMVHQKGNRVRPRGYCDVCL